MPRPLFKTLTYSLMHLTVAITVAYVLTGNLALALGIGMIEPLVQTVAYSVHERIWEKWLPGQTEAVVSVHASDKTAEAKRQAAEEPSSPTVLTGRIAAAWLARPGHKHLVISR